MDRVFCSAACQEGFGPPEPELVVSPARMSTADFARHMSLRHQGALAGQKSLPGNMAPGAEQPYRAFHRRLHAGGTITDHRHKGE